jgi:hypothetical protein
MASWVGLKCRVESKGEGMTEIWAVWVVECRPNLGDAPHLGGFTQCKDRTSEGDEGFEMKLPAQKTKFVSSPLKKIFTL